MLKSGTGAFKLHGNSNGDWCDMLGFMHQPDEPKSLSCWEEVGNSLILHNTPTHMQPEQNANVEIKKGAEDLKDASTKTRTRDLWL